MRCRLGSKRGASGAEPQVVRRRNLSTVEQSRYLATAIPGPLSQALIDRKSAAVSRGVGNTMSGIRIAGVRRHRRRRRRQPAYRSGFGHRGDHHRELVAGRRRRGRRPGGPVHPHVFHDHAVRGLCRGRRATQPTDTRHRREALGAVQLRLGSGGERDQDRQDLHTQAGSGVVRSRVSRPDQPDDGVDRQVDALQARLRPVRTRDLPCPAVLPVPRR